LRAATLIGEALEERCADAPEPNSTRKQSTRSTASSRDTAKFVALKPADLQVTIHNDDYRAGLCPPMWVV
jgi:hypothetical protein